MSDLVAILEAEIRAKESELDLIRRERETEIEHLRKALANVLSARNGEPSKTVSPDQFANARKLSDAIEEYLLFKGSPAPTEEIIDSMLAGGAPITKKTYKRSIPNSLKMNPSKFEEKDGLWHLKRLAR